MGILNKVDISIPPHETASRYIDLNIGQIVVAVSECWGRNVSNFYADFASDRQNEQYRREIYAGIKELELYDVLCSSYETIEQVKELIAKREKQSRRQQQMLTYVNEVQMYCSAIDSLMEALPAVATPDSSPANLAEGIEWLRDMLTAYTSTPAYTAMRDEARSVCAALGALKITFIYENERLQVVIDDTQPSADAGNHPALLSPFRDETDLAGLEFALIIHLEEKRPALFKRIKKFYAEYEDYRDAQVIQFFEEIPFYLSYIKFEYYMQEHGFSMTMSTADEAAPMQAEDLYDLALAVANIKRGREVVRNSFIYQNDEQFFVLTGPNQGGKTTFARSLGQLVYLSKLGLPVPAASANVHYFADLLTHFSVEESIETGRGKLLEELVRLKPMMEQSGRHFVVINELFTTAANYDACIMGKRVLQHFIKSGCCGIYVTHLAELLEGTGHAAGLCAQLNAEGVQTFKILRRVMEYNNCAAAQVGKYRLSYNDLAERLSAMDLK